MDVSRVGLHILRNKISLIPKLPFIVHGTLRENLDPYCEFDDEIIEHTLKDLKLLEHIN